MAVGLAEYSLCSDPPGKKNLNEDNHGNRNRPKPGNQGRLEASRLVIK